MKIFVKNKTIRRAINILLFSFPALIISYLFYLSDHISFVEFINSIILYPIFILITLLIWDLRNRYIGDGGRSFYKYVYIGLGGWIIWLLTFFGGAFILWCYNINLRSLGVPLWLSGLIFFVIPWIIGGILGYYWGRRRSFKPYGL